MAYTFVDAGLEFSLTISAEGDEEWYGATLALASDWINYTSLRSNLLERREVSGLYNFVKRWAEGDFTATEISFMEFELVLKYEPKYHEIMIAVEIDSYDEGKTGQYYSFPIEKEDVSRLYNYLEEAVPNRLKREWK
ncbi:hypothetical protein P3T51_07990 [Weissella confusa]|uniref:hypothetical protein n=1 Tax=Weissella confusa TaxID=1583 RepID=UPI0024078920|nr:hypothetical protein [Weissella confusa]WEY47506.1 hypothetical protein P3T51_07990 [Weissella confusa]